MYNPADKSEEKYVHQYLYLEQDILIPELEDQKTEEDEDEDHRGCIVIEIL